jgi:hypothetical protein
MKPCFVVIRTFYLLSVVNSPILQKKRRTEQARKQGELYPDEGIWKEEDCNIYVIICCQFIGLGCLFCNFLTIIMFGIVLV